MNGKEAMQEEFFHTFNALLDKGSQVIISADRAPNKLSRIQDRIKSRFAGGLVVDVQKPDYELRSKIVKQKTEELNIFYSNQVNISEEIQRFISTEITQVLESWLVQLIELCLSQEYTTKFQIYLKLKWF